MSARPRKSPSGNKKSDIKTTIIIILLVVVAIESFMLFGHKGPKSSSRAYVKTPSSTLKAEKGARSLEGKAIPVVVPVKPSVPKVKAAPGSAGKIAFVLDDWGYTMHNCQSLKNIAAPLTVAVLPNLKHSDDIIKCADVAGKDVMLHLPLEPFQNNDRYPDNYLITTAMKPAQVIQLLEDTIRKMPAIIGVNNHMGSKATEDRSLMKVIFQRLKKHNLFFVDSMTSPHHSICGELATEMKLPFAQRDVFLDNVNAKEDIKKQIVLLAQKARKKGSAIAIGHDRDLTMEVLEEQIPVLQDEGFEIVGVKALLKNK